jgi:uncharacterized OB-fold protein
MISPVKVWRNQKYIARMLGKFGTVISWTIVRVPPADFGYQAPYPVALVRLDNGESLCVQVVDCQSENLKLGQRVVTVVRKAMQSETDDVIPYGIKVKLI